MKKHTKVYYKAFGYSLSDFVPCEVGLINSDIETCNKEAVDIHHIKARGMGNSKKKRRIEKEETKDVPENLMALCRYCHDEYGDKKQHRQFLVETHEKFMQDNGR